MKWIAPPKTRAELAQIERVMQGRCSIGEPVLRRGVSIGAGAAMSIGLPKPKPGVCECTPPCIAGVPIFPNSQNHCEVSSNMTEQDKQVAANVGASEAAFIKAKAWDGKLGVMRKTSPFLDHKPDNFDDNRGGGREFLEAASDDDGSYPADSDQSAGAHIARAKNHLEALGDPDDEVAPDRRIDKAIDALMKAREQRRGSAGLGQHARVRFVR
jgi:hypothetical protein